MKSNFVFSFIFVLQLSFGQNYQSIYSNQVNYFGTNNEDTFLATRTDSVVIVDSDSIFYSFQQLRPVNQLDFELGANWYGQKVIIKDNGTNLFFNQNNDTISILTEASLNDTFQIYIYPNGDFIKGWVSAMTEETHLGQLDSVKTISLFSNSPDYQINLTELKIGKTLGFITVFPFYSFPEPYDATTFNSATLLADQLILSGSEVPKRGITRLTAGEIYDYEIGDIIHFKKTSFFPQTAGGITETFVTNLKVIDKEIWGNDSVRYQFEKKTANHSYDLITESLQYVISPIIVEDKFYYNLNTYFSETLPGEAVIDSSNTAVALISSLKRSNECQNPIVETLNDFELFFNPSNGVITCALCNPKRYEYFEKTGGPYASGLNASPASDFNTTVIFHMNTDGNCGDEWYLSTNGSTWENKKLSAFPNPFVNTIQLRIPLNSAENYGVHIYNSHGQILKEWLVSGTELSSGHLLNLQNLAKGQYIAEVIGTDFLGRKLIIKQ
ncbi:MAG: T9SS type A sorting domain-containing protein [Crocinitomicaceae bacterium]